jgi:AI-2E family transporter
MMTSLKTLEPWLKFAGCVLVIAVLYWAQAFLVPLALAVLLAFFLAPVVALFQRRLGQVPAVMTVAIIVFALMGLAAWGLVGQGTSLANELPTYRTNIRQKLQDIRGTGKGGSVEKIQETVKVIKAEIDKPEEPRQDQAVVVKPELWGPLGLLMATPLTVCLVVLGEYVPAMAFVATLMSDEPDPDADVTVYQRLLAEDPSEAADLIEEYMKTGSPETVYDAMLLPALGYAERDRVEGRLTTEEEHSIISSVRELLGDTGIGVPEAPAEDATAPPAAVPLNRISVLGCPANEGDEVALRMLERLLAGSQFSLEITTTRRAAMPELKIIVGRWAPPALADEVASLGGRLRWEIDDTHDRVSSLSHCPHQLGRQRVIIRRSIV